MPTLQQIEEAPLTGPVADPSPDAEMPPAKPKRPRKRKSAPMAADEAMSAAPPPPPPTTCRECHTPFDWRDAAYVPARAGALCKRCFQRQERETLTRGRMVKSAPGGGSGSNRAQLRAAGVRNRAQPSGAYPLQLDLSHARPKTQSSGRRAHKRHHVPCLCCWTPSATHSSQRGAA